ncbi:MAG: AraC family transcriptional regulator [Lachnospiraceae bacterium]|nr:AraC family transcriptional regulator [Lachnospiraceae bacterium]
MSQFETMLSAIIACTDEFSQIIKTKNHFEIIFTEKYPDIQIYPAGPPCPKEFYDKVLSNGINLADQAHSHNCFLLIYVYQGTNIEIIEQEKYIMTDKDLMLITPGIQHCNLYTDQSKVFFIHLAPQLVYQILLPALADDIMLADFFASFLNDSQTKQIILFEKCIDSVSMLLEHIIEEFVQKQIAYKSSLRYLVSLLLLRLIRHNTRTKLNISAVGEKQIQDILKYITMNYRELSLEKLSNHFHYRPSYLSALIKKHTGKNYSKLISDYKLEQAALYLKQNFLSINEISHICGYQDASSFYKAFKKKFGCTPRKYWLFQI